MKCDANFFGINPENRAVFHPQRGFSLASCLTTPHKEPHSEHERLASVKGGNKERTANSSRAPGRT